MAKVFSEVFEAMARTADPAQLNNFFRQASKLANWWKAQAVGTPGFVMRNMIGAAWMNNQLAGMPLSQMRRVVNIRDAARKAGQRQHLGWFGRSDRRSRCGQRLEDVGVGWGWPS